VVITNKDIYFELQKVSQAVGAMAPQAGQLMDHENRIRGIERWKYALPVTVVSSGIAVYVGLRHG
jgi:hypothetical protein